MQKSFSLMKKIYKIAESRVYNDLLMPKLMIYNQ